METTIENNLGFGGTTKITKTIIKVLNGRKLEIGVYRRIIKEVGRSELNYYIQEIKNGNFDR
jgi:hypothetical protein